MNQWKPLAAALLLTAFAATATAAEIVVSAAASLTNAFGEIGKEFEKANPGHKVLFNFASSGALLQQIARGAPVDVFASADEETMDKAVAQKLVVVSSRTDFARNDLVVVVPAGSGESIADLKGLAGKRIGRIALGNPDTVPAGKYAKEALEAAGLWEALQAKLINTMSVRQSLDYVARGEVDAGFVYSTDAAAMPGRVKVALAVPTGTPIRYPIAAVKGSGKEGLAQRFIEFVAAAPGRVILLRHGFLAVE